MSTFKHVEDIEAWQTARALSRDIYSASNLGLFHKDFSLRDQMRRASISIISNIAEGFERDGNAEFIQFLSIAKGSAGELKAQLYIAYDQKYIDYKKFSELLNKTVATGAKIAGLMKYLHQSNLKGVKFK